MGKNDIHELKEPTEEAGPNMASKMDETWLEEGHSVQVDLKDSPTVAHCVVNIKCVQVGVYQLHLTMTILNKEVV